MIEESHNIEHKESWRDEYLKWICGFANAQGGRVYIGVDDERNVVGVEDSKRLMEDIPNRLSDSNKCISRSFVGVELWSAAGRMDCRQTVCEASVDALQSIFGRCVFPLG